MKRSSIAVILLLTASLAGCGMSEPVVTLGITERTESATQTGVKMNLTVGLTGHMSIDTTVEDVRVCFVDSDDDLLETVTIGTITQDDPLQDVTIEVPERPAVIALGYGEVDSNADFSVQGMRHEESGSYSVFYPDENYCLISRIDAITMTSSERNR